MFKIIGADQTEYGPVSAEQIRQWIAEGRANGQTRAQRAGATDWKPLSSFPEFAAVLGVQTAATPPSITAAPIPAPDLLQGDYDLRIGRCFARGWDLLMNKFGIVFGGTVVFIAIEFAIGLMGVIPIVGPLISIGSLIIAGPLMGGFYYFFLKNIRGQPAEVGDIFAGFRFGFLQLMLGYIVTVILSGLAAIPGGILIVGGIVAMVANDGPGPIQAVLVVIGVMLALIPLIYLGVSWLFSLPLIIDKGMEFWPAMETSRRKVGKHWWRVFGLCFVGVVVNIAGVVACCVGSFFTMPVVFGAMMFAYEDIFSAAKRSSD